MTEREKLLAKADELAKDGVKASNTQKPEWGGWRDFQPKEKLLELYNAASLLSAMFEENIESEDRFWDDVGETSEVFRKDFHDAMEYCSKMIESLSEYQAQLVRYEMFEKYK